jgi:hypothetical protein
LAISSWICEMVACTCQNTAKLKSNQANWEK